MPESPKSGHVFAETETRSSKNPLATRSQCTLGATPRNRRDPSENGAPPKIIEAPTKRGLPNRPLEKPAWMDRAASAPKALQTYSFVALSSENDPFAQAETPNTLHCHSDEFTDQFGTAERRGRPAYEPGTKQKVPNVQGYKQCHATPEVTRRLERNVAVHATAMPFATPVGSASWAMANTPNSTNVCMIDTP